MELLATSVANQDRSRVLVDLMVLAKPALELCVLFNLMSLVTYEVTMFATRYAEVKVTALVTCKVTHWGCKAFSTSCSITGKIESLANLTVGKCSLLDSCAVL